MRMLWLIAGLFALGFGIVGVVLPLVPTTGPVLIAAWCFARSSPRLHAWLMTHPRLGPPIRDWRLHGAIGRRAKWLASASLALAFGLSLALGAPDWVLAAQALALAGVAAFIWTRPDGAVPDPFRDR
jgi:uncharacterized protein